MDLLRGTLDLMIVRTLLPGPTHGRSKWEAFVRAMGLLLKPTSEEGR
jgi:hypothetical protein